MVKKNIRGCRSCRYTIGVRGWAKCGNPKSNRFEQHPDPDAHCIAWERFLERSCGNCRHVVRLDGLPKCSCQDSCFYHKESSRAITCDEWAEKEDG